MSLVCVETVMMRMRVLNPWGSNEGKQAYCGTMAEVEINVLAAIQLPCKHTLQIRLSTIKQTVTSCMLIAVSQVSQRVGSHSNFGARQSLQHARVNCCCYTHTSVMAVEAYSKASDQHWVDRLCRVRSKLKCIQLAKHCAHTRSTGSEHVTRTFGGVGVA